MKQIFGTHRARYAVLFGGDAFLALFSVYLTWVPEESVKVQAMDTGLWVAFYWAMVGLGVFLWIAGGVVFGRDRGFNGFVAFLIHLILPVLGLLLMALLRRRLTPHEAW